MSINLRQFTHIYFLGIGGIGMSALARHFVQEGYQVAGYDRTPSPLTAELEAQGMQIHFEDSIEAIPTPFRNQEKTLAIYTPAVPAHHKELKWFRDKGFALYKRAKILATLTEGKTTLAVAGTHGKTSTTSMIAHLLHEAQVPFVAFLGGISSNYETNYIRFGENGNLVVVEADEYDRSFHQLFPDRAVVTAVEADHLDIYGTEDQMRQDFVKFMEQVKPSGALVLHEGVPAPPQNAVPIITYSATAPADCTAQNIRICDGKYVFDVKYSDWQLDDFELSIPGNHNVENCLAALLVAHPFIGNLETAKEAMRTYKGVKRRFEKIYDASGKVYVDDYAHHPTEIARTLETLRQLYPDRKLTGVFQPHLFSRTRDLAEGFGAALDLLDEAYLLPIYPARELPITGVTEELIADNMKSARLKRVDKEQLLKLLTENTPEVLVTLGAGDIDRLVKPIKEIFERSE